MKAPEKLETRRLTLRRPRADDAEAIFERYASDPQVTRYLAWPRHRTVQESRAFIEFSDAEWARKPCGPYLIDSRESGRLLGSSGLAFEDATTASTGYVFARDAWGHGYATEALRAVVEVARELRVAHLYAICHVDHAASRRVLEKCGFSRAALLRGDTDFPNLEPGEPREMLRYELAPGDDAG